jgi:hypothetical protein
MSAHCPKHLKQNSQNLSQKFLEFFFQYWYNFLGTFRAIIMGRYEWPHTALTVDLHAGFYLDIIIGRYEGPQTALTIIALMQASTYLL